MSNPNKEVPTVGIRERAIGHGRANSSRRGSGALTKMFAGPPVEHGLHVLTAALLLGAMLLMGLMTTTQALANPASAASPATRAPAPGVFNYLDSEPRLLFRSQAGSAQVASTSGATSSQRTVIRVSKLAAQNAVISGRLPVVLPDGTSYDLRVERDELADTGDWTLVSRIDTPLGGLAAVITYGRDGVFGVLPKPNGELLQISTSRGETVLEPAGGMLPPGQELTPETSKDYLAPPPQAPAMTTGFMSDAQAEAIAAEGDVQIDVLGIYTTDLVTLRGSASAAETEFTNLLAIANQAFIDSGTVVRLNLVGLRETDYPETATNADMLDDMTNNTLPDGLDVHQLRNHLTADLVVSLRPFRPSNVICSSAWGNGNNLSPESATPAYGFSVSNVAPCGPYVLAHSLGHNLGSTHGNEWLAGKLILGAYIYSRGYSQDGPPAFSTIMVYRTGGRQTVGFFSHPGTTRCLGAACGIAGESDNVRSLNQMAPRIARFRDPPATFSILDAGVAESDTGTTNLSFTVRLSTPAPAGGVHFDIATSDGTALANSDYEPRSLTDQFIPEGQSTYTFDVKVIGDKGIEPDETININVSNVVGVEVFDAKAVGTIRNDDPKVRLSGQVRFQNVSPAADATFLVDFSISNGNQETIQTVLMAPPDYRYAIDVPRGSQVIADIENPPASYASRTVELGVIEFNTIRDIPLKLHPVVSGRILFAPGTMLPTESLTVTVLTDAESNSIGSKVVASPPDFRFEKQVSFGRTAVLRVQNVPAPFLPSQDIQLGPVTDNLTRDITLERGVVVSGAIRFPNGTVPSNKLVSVFVASGDGVSDGNGYTANPPDFRFVATVKSGQRVNLETWAEQPFARIKSDLGAVTQDTRVDIDLPLAPKISIADAKATDDQATAANFVVTLSSPAPSGGVSLTLATADGTAVVDKDYIASRQTLIFSEGEISKTFAVPLVTDGINEPDETFTVNIYSVSGAVPVNTQAMGIVLGSNEATVPAMWISDASMSEGDADTVARKMVFTVGLSRPAPVGGVSFDIETVDGTAKAGSDYVAQSMIGMSIPAGQTSANFTVTVNGDNTVEQDEAFSVAVSKVVGATLVDGLTTGVIVNDDGIIAPVVNSDHYDVNHNQPLIVGALAGVLANDRYSTGTVTKLFSANPGTSLAHGTLSLASSGAFIYTPNTGYSGEDSFAYNACNGNVCATALVTLSVAFALDPTDRYIWMLPPAINTEQQGFIRLSNHSDSTDLVTIWGVDATGRRSTGTVGLTLAAHASRQLNSQELEQGNRDRGVTGSLGVGTGNWTLVVHSALDLEALAYIRTPDGFLTPIHDRVDGDGVDWFVPMFNPADNPNQVSRLRVINTSLQAVSLQILGVDDAGAVGVGPVAVTVAALSSIELSSADLENGNAAKGLIGKLGNGTGKWHLSVSATGRVTLQSLLLDPKGYLTNLSTLPDLTERVPGERTLWLVPPASNVQQQGFVRLINRENRASDVALWGIDDAGQRSSGTVTLRMTPRQSLQLTSQDLEAGNPAKGLTGSLGSGTGNWRLVVLTDLDLMPMGLIRTPDGFLTTVHDTVAGDGLSTRVPMFNPADNPNQVSVLRLVNPNDANVSLTIRGVDDAGRASGAVTLTLAANAAVEMTATELEQGNAAKGVTGGLGNRVGKWTLTVTASTPVKVMSLLRDPKGYLTNLSNGTQGSTDKLDP